MTAFDLDLSKYNLGWSDADIEYAFTPSKGLDDGVVDQISWWKGEPRWMAQKRQRALKLFGKPRVDAEKHYRRNDSSRLPTHFAETNRR